MTFLPKHKLTIPEGKKIFFASDFHLGAPDYASSRKREAKILRWLEHIAPEAGAIFLVGDVFDFWFEYTSVVPRGYVRLLGKLASLNDAGVPLYIFSGNHDMWMYDYLPRELGAQVFHSPQVFEVNGVCLLVGHGDGLGPGDYFYKFLKRIFRNPLCQWLFARLHPNFGIGLAAYLSRRSRARNLARAADEQFLGEQEWLWQYSKQIEARQHHDFYIFGHRHLPLDLPVGNHARYFNLGEWLRYDTYGVLAGKAFVLCAFEREPEG